MEENINRLMEVIEQESEVLEILADSLYRQKEAAIKGDIEFLNKITESQNRALARLNDLDAKRMEYIIPLAEELGVSPEEISMTLLQQVYGNKFTPRRSRLLSSLKPMGDKIKSSARMNTMVLKRMMELGEERLKKMLDFCRDTGHYNLFGKKAEGAENSGVMLNRQA